MIVANNSLCDGCGVCIEVCPTDAISVVGGKAQINLTLCDQGRTLEEHPWPCIQACPAEALTWDLEPSPEDSKATTLPVTEGSADPAPPVPVQEYEIVVARPMGEQLIAPAKPVFQRRALLPAVGGALVWLRREIVPRLVPLALHALDRALDQPAGRSTRAVRLDSSWTEGRGRRQRSRHRGQD